MKIMFLTVGVKLLPPVVSDGFVGQVEPRGWSKICGFALGFNPPPWFQENFLNMSNRGGGSNLTPTGNRVSSLESAMIFYNSIHSLHFFIFFQGFSYQKMACLSPSWFWQLNFLDFTFSFFVRISLPKKCLLSPPWFFTSTFIDFTF